MDDASYYWTFLYLTAAGHLRSRPHDPARAYFEPQYSDLIAQLPSSHRGIQRRLVQHLNGESRAEIVPSQEASELSPPEACLRCFISRQIRYACQQLEDQFGKSNGFTRFDLLVLVLNDDRLLTTRPAPRPSSPDQSQHQANTYRSLATEILESFDPECSSLSNWTVRLVRHHKDINALLLEHGVYLVSDWAILNDTDLPQLERILQEFHHLSAGEIEHASVLLESYHAVYRGDRLRPQKSPDSPQNALKSSGRGRCLPPTVHQLQRMADYLTQEWAVTLSPKHILQELQTLAQQLRAYRIFIRSKVFPTESLDDPNQADSFVTLAAPDKTDDSDDDKSPLQEFLDNYQQQFTTSLDEALNAVVEHRVQFLQRRKGNRDELFLKGLHLFHCEGKTMGAIAPHLGYTRQDQVTYLLQLKQLRTDVRHHMIKGLGDRLRSLAQPFTDPSQLHHLDQRIEAVLDEQVGELIREAETESSSSRDGPLPSLFSRRLCRYLDTR